MIGTRIAMLSLLLASACGDSVVDLQGDPWQSDSADAGGQVDTDTSSVDAAPADPHDAGSADDDVGNAQAPDATTPTVQDMAPPVVPPEPPPSNAAEQVVMTLATVNIGRNYSTRAQVSAVIADVHDRLAEFAGPSFVGWQEIGEGDPCGSCEIEILNSRFAANRDWDTRRPHGDRPDGGSERVKVPITTRRADNLNARARFASAGWAGVSPTRFVTVVYSATHNVSTINTHLIAGAWSCKSEVAKRKDYWRRGWRALKEEVAREHDRGRNVVVTGDLNRGRSASNCNPAWDPTSLHGRAKIVGGSGIDYVFAVPAAGQKFDVDKRADGSARRGSINLGIDSHNAHWVRGQFLPK